MGEKLDSDANMQAFENSCSLAAKVFCVAEAARKCRRHLQHIACT
jgi:hypothetical protein